VKFDNFLASKAPVLRKSQNQRFIQDLAIAIPYAPQSPSFWNAPYH
jgi:hypothetical protein